MKKNLFKVLSLVLVALFAMTCVASAAAVEGIYADGTVTATVTGIGTTDEVTILVVPHGTALASVQPADIIYIDQVTAANGTATFSFASSTEEIDIYSGYTSMDVAAGALSDIYEVVVPPVVEPTAPEIDTTKSTLSAANAFTIAGFKRIFVKLAETESGDWMPAHSDADSSIYYSTERNGYDGLIKSEAADITAALAELTWENVAPTDEQTIKMYGDMTGDKKINVLDSARVKKLLNNLNAGTYGSNKEFLTADATGDAKVNVLDSAQLKKHINATGAGETYTFPIINK